MKCKKLQEIEIKRYRSFMTTLLKWRSKYEAGQSSAPRWTFSFISANW